MARLLFCRSSSCVPRTSGRGRYWKVEFRGVEVSAMGGDGPDRRGIPIFSADLFLRMPAFALQEILPTASSVATKAARYAGDKRSYRTFSCFLSRFGIYLRTTLILTTPPRMSAMMECWPTFSAIQEAYYVNLFWTRLAHKATSRRRTWLVASFDRIIKVQGTSGLSARVALARSVALLHKIDPRWTEHNILPRMSWSHSEAPVLWRAYGHGNLGSARLFNKLKSRMLAAFDSQDLPSAELEVFVSKLLSICIWHLRGNRLITSSLPRSSSAF